MLDERHGERSRGARRPAPSSSRGPGNYAYYRIEVTENGGAASTTLAEIELLSNEKPSPLTVTVRERGRRRRRYGRGRRRRVEHAATPPASGQITVTGPQGWTISPTTAPFGPIASGESQTVTFNVAVPAGTEPGDYPVQATVASKRGTGAASGYVHVTGDVIEFTPVTHGRRAVALEADGSQLDGARLRRHARASPTATRTSRTASTLPADVTGGTLTLDIGNQFLVEVSSDNQTWRTVLEEPLTGDVGLDEPGRARHSTSTTSEARARRSTCASPTPTRPTAGAAGSPG